VHSPDLAVGPSREKPREEFSKISSPAHLLERGSVPLPSTLTIPDVVYGIMGFASEEALWGSLLERGTMGFVTRKRHYGVRY
jgi:hypothetical protein